MTGSEGGSGEGGTGGDGGQAKESGGKPDEAKGTDEPLGEAGIKALQNERSAREKAEKTARDAQSALESLKQKHQTNEEKAIEAAKQAGRDEATAEGSAKLVRSEVRIAAAGKLADPDDAPALLGDLSRFVRDGEPDSKAIKLAIDDLLKAKPYLAPKGKVGPLPGGGGKPSTATSINDRIRAEAGRG